MVQQLIEDREQGLSVRNKINSNTTELYSAVSTVSDLMQQVQALQAEVQRLEGLIAHDTVAPYKMGTDYAIGDLMYYPSPPSVSPIQRNVLYICKSAHPNAPQEPQWNRWYMCNTNPQPTETKD